MKKALLLLLVLTFATNLIAQQEERKLGKNEFSVGLGIASDAFPESMLEELFSTLLSKELNSSIDDKKRSGFYFGYKYYFNGRWALGSTLTYKHMYKSRTKNETKQKYTQSFYGINLEGRYTYLNKRIFRMYAVAGAGIYNCREVLRKSGDEPLRATDNTVKFTYQLSPLCLELGTNVGGRMEYGYGYKGIGSIGFYVRF